MVHNQYIPRLVRHIVFLLKKMRIFKSNLISFRSRKYSRHIFAAMQFPLASLTKPDLQKQPFVQTAKHIGFKLSQVGSHDPHSLYSSFCLHFTAAIFHKYLIEQSYMFLKITKYNTYGTFWDRYTYYWRHVRILFCRSILFDMQFYISNRDRHKSGHSLHKLCILRFAQCMVLLFK